MATTQRMQVANEAFLLDRLAADAPRAQLYRELTQNAIEAVRRRMAAGDQRPGVVQWDIDWLGVPSGQQKLCIIDNGDGMSSNDMQRYLNSLAVQGANGAQGLTGNFGLGAKITALFHNRQGLLYLSWKGGEGHNVWLHRDDQAGVYGLKLLEDAEGAPTYVRRMSDAAKPELIGRSGTKVILLGADAKAETWRKPEGLAGGETNWLYKHLNTRYFRLPENITVKVRNLRRDPSSWPEGEPPAGDGTLNFITVRGMKAILDGQVATRSPAIRQSGVTALPGCNVHWWLFDDRDIVDVAVNPKAAPPGHVGIVFQDEIYTLRSGAQARKLMAMFGILYGADRVVLYVEPDAVSGRVAADTARGRLMIDGEDADANDLWARWGADFRTRLPVEIAAFSDRLLARDEGGDRTERRERILERLRRLQQHLRPDRYRAKADGDRRAEESTSAPAKGIPEKPRDRPQEPGPSLTKSEHKRADYLARLSTDAGRRAVDVSGPSAPQTVWISVARGQRAVGELEDRAADVPGDVLKADVVRLNEDFRGFAELFNLFIDETGAASDPSRSALVTDVVKEWLETQVLEVVMSVRAMQTSRLWGPQDFEAALSPEALTAALMGRYLIAERVRRALALRIGRDVQAA